MQHRFLVLMTTLVFLGSWNTGLAKPPGSQGSYFVLTARQNQPPPFASVRFTYGPIEEGTSPPRQWWQLDVRRTPEFDSKPIFTVRALTTGDPLESTTNIIVFSRYLLHIAETEETYDYRNVRTGEALIPGWGDFVRYFIPRRPFGTGAEHGLPQTSELLGQVLTLHHTRQDAPWESWTNVLVRELDPELLIGTSRPFRDSEGHRLPQHPERRNYTYVPFTAEDYRVMIDAGVNLFTIQPNQEQWVRGEPVFYLRGATGKPALRYPADLYRANYLGPVMFMDEPSILMVGDTNVHRTLRYFCDAAVLIEKRTRVTYESSGSYGAWALEKALLDQRFNLGDMRLKQVDIPSWETLYETAFYQMRAGGMGIVHEGRYQLKEFDEAVTRFTGNSRNHTARELLQYYYAFLRGATRPFGKHWGTAIYGQCDTNIAPLALTLAYDMGARYLWFWTSDHDHHVPWPEQLALTRHLRNHARQHPRPALVAPPKVDVAIVVPYGYFLSLENLWWVRVLDPQMQNAAAQRYRRLMQRAVAAVHSCFDAGRTFDITVNDGRPITGYAEIVRLSDD